MDVSYIQVNEIFKTLPIGYYLGRNIDCSLSETVNSSFFAPEKDCIIISYPMIRQALYRVEGSKDEVEELVRSILYHEISHVILTPKSFAHGMEDYHNIVEDERIETIFRKYYMNTNFRKTVKLVNNYDGHEPTSADEAFYMLVRFRVGTDEWLKRLKELICNYAYINAEYDYDIDPYKMKITDFYWDFRDWWNANKNSTDNSEEKGTDNKGEINNTNYNNTSYQNSSESNNSSMDSNMDSNKEDKEDNNQDNNQDTKTVQNSKNSGTGNNDLENSDSEGADSAKNGEDNNESESMKDMEDDIYDSLPESDVIKKAIRQVINQFHNENLTSKFAEIINRKLKENKNKGAAINSYSGKLDKRSVGTRDDYKWWITSNREGNIRAFSNVHFNLFIDNSGSFHFNDNTVNTLIKSLDKISKSTPKFTFDVITINTRVREWKNHDNLFKSSGGNCLHDNIALVIKRHKKLNANTYNIVLFDGDAHTDDYEFSASIPASVEPFRHFNLSNTIIISDYENKKYIHKCITKARVIYTDNYCEELINNLCTLLERVV